MIIRIVFTLLLIFVFNDLFSQVETSEYIDSNYAKAMQDVTHTRDGKEVIEFKDSLHLILKVDKITLGEQEYPINKLFEKNINYETGEIKLTDQLSIRIYVSRNQEEGEKFYSWNWAYYRHGRVIKQIGTSGYHRMNYGTDYQLNFSPSCESQGIGVEKTPDFILICYRYKIE